MGMEHIAPIIERVTAELAERQTRRLSHDLKCPYWERIDPHACSCSSRPVVDLLLAIAQRRAA